MSEFYDMTGNTDKDKQKNRSIHSYARRVRHATQVNSHTDALRIIAKYIKQEKSLSAATRIIKSLDAIEVIHDFYGQLPRELSVLRGDMRNSLFMLLDEKEQKTFYNEL